MTIKCMSLEQSLLKLEGKGLLQPLHYAQAKMAAHSLVLSLRAHGAIDERTM